MRYVLPRILESKNIAKAGRTKQKQADLECSVAKQFEKMLSEVHKQALICCDAIHHERRILLKQEIERMVLFFTDQPSLRDPDIQDFRKDWLSILMIVTSSRSAINIRHLDKATVSTAKEGLLTEGNAAFNWSRVPMAKYECRARSIILVICGFVLYARISMTIPSCLQCL